jgi:hypothetical protein
VKSMIQTSFHLRRMVRVEVEISASVVSFLTARTSRKGNRLYYSISIVDWMDGLKLLRSLRKSCNRSGPCGQTKHVSSTYRRHSDGLCCADSRINFSKCSMKMLRTMGDSEFPIDMPFFVGRTCRLSENMWFSGKPPAAL